MKEPLADESMKRKCNFGMRKLERVGGVYVESTCMGSFALLWCFLWRKGKRAKAGKEKSCKWTSRKGRCLIKERKGVEGVARVCMGLLSYVRFKVSCDPQLHMSCFFSIAL